MTTKTQHPKYKDGPITYSSPNQFSPAHISNHPTYSTILSTIVTNSNWSIDTLYAYCNKYYSHQGFTKHMFQCAVREYIDTLIELHL